MSYSNLFYKSTKFMCMFSKFFPNAEEMSAYTFKKMQSDSDDDDQCDVEDIYNFEELV